MTKLPLPKLRRVPEAALKALEEHRLLDPTPLSPCANQTEAEIEKYYRNAEIGDIAVVRNTQGYVLQYTVLEISDRRPDIGSIYVGNQSYYMKNGKMRRHPTGQISLVVPTNEVLAWHKEHLGGETGYTIYRPTKP